MKNNSIQKNFFISIIVNFIFILSVFSCSYIFFYQSQKRESTKLMAEVFLKNITLSIKNELLSRNEMFALELVKNMLSNSILEDNVCLNITRISSSTQITFGNSNLCIDYLSYKEEKIFFDNSNSELAYTIKMYYSELPIKVHSGSFIFSIFLIISLYIFLLYRIYKTFSKFILTVVEIVSGVSNPEIVESDSAEIRIVKTAKINFLNTQRAYLENENKILKLNYIYVVAQQVAHDIRSPLSALSMVASTLKDIPEEKRIIIRNATQRINDIANDLLSKGKTDSVKDIAIENAEQNIIGPLKSNQASGKSLRIEFLPALVDILVSEKRMQYMKRSDLEIDVDLTQGFGAFATVDDKELKRVMSNLINNSVESFDETTYESQQKKNTINIEVIKINKEQAEIVIKDNGKGIPEDILSKLGTEQLSYGKNSSAESGTGLGLYHAKKTIESMNGQFKIESALSKGTTVRLILPLSKTPDWFATEVNLVNKTMLVSLDDDTSIHQIWSGRLQSLGLSDKIQHIRFQSYELFENYINQNIDKLSQMQMLVDYELLNQSKTGLDVIEDLVLEKYAILVTSRYEESQIQERARKLNLKILPKALSGSVPFLYAKSEIQSPNVSNINETDSYDWVLLDDDELVHMTWKFEAKNKNKKLISFKTVNELNSQKTAINKNSKIYIDSNLGNGVKGEEIAKALYDEGYAQIYLATGYQAESFQHLKFLKGVVGKDPPKD
ncbi:MAG: sensor histidine kinase [Pseudobdellovibrio sp.]